MLRPYGPQHQQRDGPSSGEPLLECAQLDGHYLHEPGLQQFCREHPGRRYVLAAVGDHVGQTEFVRTDDPFGGVVSTPHTQGPTVSLPMTTIDKQVEKHGLRPPFFIKLDTHGYEIEILEGARQALQRTSLLLLEVYNFQLRPGVPRFHQVCAHLETLGFRCSDAADITYRDHDRALWQMDLLFEPASAKVFTFERWA